MEKEEGFEARETKAIDIPVCELNARFHADVIHCGEKEWFAIVQIPFYYFDDDEQTDPREIHIVGGGESPKSAMDLCKARLDETLRRGELRMKEVGFYLFLRR